MDIKKIGILTSGGDAPGMNAVIYSVVKYAQNFNLQVFGVYKGYSGLIEGNLKVLNLSDVEDIAKRGGTILYSARCLEFKKQQGLERGFSSCVKNGINGLIVVGGDGSFQGASNLSKKGISCIGLPGTIDNDICCTDYSIGYDTAVNTAVEMVDRLCDTIASHDRCSVVEVMGRNSGYIALDVGISCCANYIVVKEVEFNKKDLFSKIKKSMSMGKKHFVIIVAEGILDVHELAKEIESETGVESRGTVLGHVQRGGSPTAKDRTIATKLGIRAVDLLRSGAGSKIVGLKKDELVEYEIEEGLALKKEFPKDLYDMVSNLY